MGARQKALRSTLRGNGGQHASPTENEMQKHIDLATTV
jgi:hypothetical protein